MAPSSRHAWLWRVLASPLTRALLALVAVVVAGLIFSADGAFYKWGTHRDMLRQVSVYGILAAGMTVVIVTAGIDLSVGSVLGLSAVLFSVFTLHWQWSAWSAVPACLIIGVLLGATSGSVIARFGVQPFIATLAMMVFARGFAKFVTDGQKISNYIQKPDGTFEMVETPAIFDWIDSSYLGNNLAAVTIIMAVCFFVTGIVLSRLRSGRYVYATGGNEDAAWLSGVPVRMTKILAYSLSGLFASVAGICQAAQERQGDPEAGVSYELTAIAIVVIGGTSLMGGRGGILLTVLGTLTIGYLEKILSINAVGEAGRLMLTGGIIVAAVLFQRGKKVYT
ncbi:MAG: hypothetical protein AMXMBFR84_49030 [Candidatus Hydrogenedentota bacterium]